MTRFGDFDDAAREYVISRPDTPLPWINYLGSEDYFGIISNTAGGYSFFRDARLRRLTRYRYNNVPPTPAGGTSTCATGERRLLVAVVAADPSRRRGLPLPPRSRVHDHRVAPRGHRGRDAVLRPARRDARDLAVTRITNRRDTVAQLSLFSAVEFCLWDAWDDATNLQRNLSIGEVEVDGGVIYHTTEYRERRNHFAYFACSAELAGFDTDRDRFLGPYRGWDRPRSSSRGVRATRSRTAGHRSARTTSS